ncbi:hypothetical protein MKX01_038814 [Papaver californicum]|nr:hypothetical protein MKX01_038814 [Papaver californicum]
MGAANKSYLTSSLIPFTVHKLRNPKIKFNHRQEQISISSSFTSQAKHIINLDETKQIHAHMIKTQFNHNHAISFDFFQQHSSPASLFNFIISSYVKNNSPVQALRIYGYMRETDSDIDTFTIPSILKGCSQLSWSLKQGQEIHGGYSRSKAYDKALDLISEMQFLRVKPSAVAMLNMVNLFADLGSPKMARLIHAYVVKNSDISSLGVPITTALLDMYAKCGHIALARRLFGRLDHKTVVSWSAMIAGYIRCNKLEDGVELFVKMQDENILPNEITLLSLVLECGFVGALNLGKQVHAYMIRNGFQVADYVVNASLSSIVFEMW